MSKTIKVENDILHNQLDSFQISHSILCDYFGLANCLKSRFIMFLHTGYFPHKPPSPRPTAHLALMNADKLWEFRVPVLAKGRCYEYVIASNVRFAIGDEDVQVMMSEPAIGSLDQPPSS